MLSYLIVAVVSALAGGVGSVLFYRRNQNKVKAIATLANDVASTVKTVSSK